MVLKDIAMSNELFEDLKRQAQEFSEKNGVELFAVMLELLLEEFCSPDDEYEDGPQNEELENFCSYIRTHCEEHVYKQV